MLENLSCSLEKTRIEVSWIFLFGIQATVGYCNLSIRVRCLSTDTATLIFALKYTLTPLTVQFRSSHLVLKIWGTKLNTPYSCTKLILCSIGFAA